MSGARVESMSELVGYGAVMGGSTALLAILLRLF